MSSRAIVILVLVLGIPILLCGGCIGYGFLMTPAEVDEIEEIDAERPRQGAFEIESLEDGSEAEATDETE